MNYSYATERKIRLIKDAHGEDWASKFPGRSIDSIYNEVQGDTRKNLFCKLRADVKDKLDVMTQFYEINIAELIERLVEREHERFLIAEKTLVNDMAKQFSS